MSQYNRVNVRIKEALISLRGGTVADVHASIAARELDPPSEKTIERHLIDLRALGVVVVNAELRDGRPRKVWKVIKCLSPTGDVPTSA